ncbi:MAG: MFS transporter [Bacillota bacterium]|nr:MFS transporter [Bacillota bacterium]
MARTASRELHPTTDRPSPGEKPGRNYKWWALSSTTLGAFLSVLNGTTLIIALPDLMRTLRASFAEVVWILMGYQLMITILVPSVGRVADMIGRKRLYVTGFAVFTLGALLAGFSRTPLELIALRVFQAVGGSLMLANSTAIVTDAFPKRELGRALGINSMVIAVGSIVGPVLGGFLTNFGWQWVIWFNVPLGLVGTAWAWLQLREVVKLPEHQRFDVWGTLAFTLGLFLVLVVLTLGPGGHWLEPSIVAMAAAAVLLLAFFVWWEGRTDQPMLDLRLFRSRLLAAAYSSTWLNGIARGSVTFLLVFYFQGIRGYDPVTAGVLLAPFAAAMLVLSPVSGWLSDRYGSRELASLGLVISAVGLVGLARLGTRTPIPVLAVWMAVMGAGSGLFNSPNTNAIMGAVVPERRGIAGGTRTMANNLGMMISIALSLDVMSSTMRPEALQGLFSGVQVGSAGIAVADFVHGVQSVFWLSVAISLLAAFLSLLRGPAPMPVQPARRGGEEGGS